MQVISIRNVPLNRALSVKIERSAVPRYSSVILSWMTLVRSIPETSLNLKVTGLQVTSVRFMNAGTFTVYCESNL